MEIGVAFAFSMTHTGLHGTRAKTYGKQMKFSIGDIVGLVKYPEHKGFVVEVLEGTEAVPTIIVEWFDPVLDPSMFRANTLRLPHLEADTREHPRRL